MAEIDAIAAEAAPLAAQLRDLEGLADSFGRAMTTAFRRSVVDGQRLEDVLRSLALSLSSRALNPALAPIGQGIGAFRAARRQLRGAFGRRRRSAAERAFAAAAWCAPVVRCAAASACRRGGAGGDPALARGPMGELGVRGAAACGTSRSM